MAEQNLRLLGQVQPAEEEPGDAEGQGADAEHKGATRMATYSRVGHRCRGRELLCAWRQRAMLGRATTVVKLAGTKEWKTVSTAGPGCRWGCLASSWKYRASAVSRRASSQSVVPTRPQRRGRQWTQHQVGTRPQRPGWAPGAVSRLGPAVWARCLVLLPARQPRWCTRAAQQLAFGTIRGAEQRRKRRSAAAR